ncbi:MAG: signal transduction histidine kinase [Salibacteraceae bacterium]|jgi:signal transduction histidine kinase
MSIASTRVSRFFILLAIGLNLSSSFSIAQSSDSTSIVSFFSPQNLPKINETSKDSLFALLKGDIHLIDIYTYQNANLLLITGQFDEAKTSAEKTLKNSPKKLGEYSKAKYFNLIGKVHANRQESQKAISFFQKALQLSEDAGEGTNAAMMNSNIANIYFSLVDYESAYKYAWKGYLLMKDYPDHWFYSNLMAVLSISEAKLGKMKAAKEHGQIALKSAESKNSILAILVANLALGEVAISKKEFATAKEYLGASLEMSEKYQVKAFIILNSIGLMSANLGTKDFSLAVMHGEKAISLVDQSENRTTLYSIKKNLAKAYFGTKQFSKAYQFMEESHAIFLDKNGIENKKAINELLVKYDTEKKEKALAKSNGKLLQEKVDRRNLTLVLVILFVVLIGLVLGLFFIRERNKIRMELLESKKAKEVIQAIFETEEIERERIAHELHDGVASNLVAARYQVLTNTAIGEDEKRALEELLLQTHEETRRLSHNLAPIYIEKFGFAEALVQFAKDNRTEKCKLYTAVLPSDAIIEKNKANVLYRVAQELTQNAIKHANANEISIQIMVEDVHKVTLLVEDNGKGFDVELSKHSNGLASIFRRANQLDGYFHIDSNSETGTIATFSI